MFPYHISSEVTKSCHSQKLDVLRMTQLNMIYKLMLIMIYKIDVKDIVSMNIKADGVSVA